MHLNCLRAVILTEADGTLAVETVGPEAVELNVALTQLGVSDQKPGTKDTLGENVQDSVGNDFTVNTDLAGTVGKTPDTIYYQQGNGSRIRGTYMG